MECFTIYCKFCKHFELTAIQTVFLVNRGSRALIHVFLKYYFLVINYNHSGMDAKVYIGGLPNDATSQEIEDVFYRFGRIRKVWVARRPPGFAFVEFEDGRDAEDAVKALDGSYVVIFIPL